MLKTLFFSNLLQRLEENRRESGYSLANIGHGVFIELVFPDFRKNVS